jgi:hypothetical protein
VNGSHYSLWLAVPAPAKEHPECKDHFVPLTIAWSDADDPGGGQKSLIATSALKFAKPETFGTLGIFGNGQRYPAYGDAERVPAP